MKKYADIWNRFFFAIIGISLLAGVSTQFFNATISLHVNSMGGNAAFTGVLMTVFTIAASVFRLVGGHLSDRLGRRPVILSGLFVFFAATLACGLVLQLGWLVLFRVLQGIGFAAAGTGMSVAVADVVRKEKIGEAIGYFGLGNSLTQAVGPGVALALMAGSGGFSSVAFVAAGGLALAMLITFFTNYERIPEFARPQPEHHVETQRQLSFWGMFEKKAVPAAIVQFTVSVAFGSVLAFLTLYAAQRNIENAGLFFTLMAICTVGARLVTGRLTDKYGTIFSVVPGLVLGIVSFACLALAAQLPVLFFVAGAFYGLANGLIGPALNATAIRRSPAHRRGAASATYMVPLELALALAAMMWGAVIDRSSFEVVFWCCCGILALALLLSFVFFGRKKI